MRRTIRSYRTRSNIRDTNALRDQFIRELTLEANAVLKQLTSTFGRVQAALAPYLLVPVFRCNVESLSRLNAAKWSNYPSTHSSLILCLISNAEVYSFGAEQPAEVVK